MPSRSVMARDRRARTPPDPGGHCIMKAAVIAQNGVEIRDVAKPAPAATQVLVRVRAASLNRADVIMASGHMHGSAGGPGAVLGLEFAGEIEAVGAEVKGVKAGDRVMCSGNGGYAEHAV